MGARDASLAFPYCCLLPASVLITSPVTGTPALAFACNSNDDLLSYRSIYLWPFEEDLYCAQSEVRSDRHNTASAVSNPALSFWGLSPSCADMTLALISPRFSELRSAFDWLKPSVNRLSALTEPKAVLSGDVGALPDVMARSFFGGTEAR